MKKYIDSMLVGLGIGSFILTIYAAIYWGFWFVLLVLIQSALQGLASVIIHKNLPLPYLARFIIHALTSYLLAFTLLLYMMLAWKVPVNAIFSFSISWVVSFAVIYTYFYFRDRHTAEKINQKLGANHENHQS
ncbi:hypothetical protein OfM1_20770 [Lactovum odontotermitis]